MNRLSTGLIAASFLVAPLAVADQHVAPLGTDVQNFSYAIGMRTGESMLEQGLDADTFSPEAFVQAIKDVFEGAEPRLTQEEMVAALRAVSTQIAEKAAASAQAAAEAGVVFLQENASAEGVFTTASGLQYRVDVAGDGPKPMAEDTVEVHYAGRLLDGTPFDSSYDRGQPTQFPVSAVIPGWTEVLQLMPVGSKYEVWIPQELGYGERGAGDAIPPYAMLNFTVELLSIVAE